MATKKFDGNGSTIKIADSATAAAGVNSIDMGGWSLDELDASNLDTTGFKKKLTSSLKNADPVQINVDTLDEAAFTGAAKGAKYTVTSASGKYTFVFYGDVSKVKMGSLKNGEIPTTDITITLTNITADPVVTITA